MAENEPEVLDVPEDISEEEADKLFESNGEIPEEKAENVEPEPEEVETSPADKDKELSENYKKAMQEERQKRQEIERKMAVMEERFQQMLQPQDQTPSIEDDPISNFDTRIQGIEKANAELEHQRQIAQQEQQVVTVYQQQAHEFAEKNPEFKEAYSYLVSNRIEELKTLGLDQITAQQAAAQEEFGIALKSLRDGVNPAERLFQIAKMRGFQKATEAHKPNLKVVDKGVKSAKPSNSSAPQDDLSLEAIAEMDDEEFAKAWEKLKKQNQG